MLSFEMNRFYKVIFTLSVVFLVTSCFGGGAKDNTTISQGNLTNDSPVGDDYEYVKDLERDGQRELPEHLLEIGAESEGQQLAIGSENRDEIKYRNFIYRGYTCYQIKENDRYSPRAAAYVNTIPMIVRLYRRSGGESIVDRNTMCTQQIKRPLNCLQDVDVEAPSTSFPVFSSDYSCLAENEMDSKNYSYLLVEKNPSMPDSIEFSCFHSGVEKTGSTKIELSMDECVLEYNLGSKLPAVDGMTKIVLEDDKIKLNYKYNFVIGDSDLFDYFFVNSIHYVSIVQRKENGTFRRTGLERSNSVHPKEFIGGSLEWSQPGLAQEIMDIGVENLFVFWGGSHDLKSGHYAISLVDICKHGKNQIVYKSPNNVLLDLCR